MSLFNHAKIFLRELSRQHIIQQRFYPSNYLRMPVRMFSIDQNADYKEVIKESGEKSAKTKPRNRLRDRREFKTNDTKIEDQKDGLINEKKIEKVSKQRDDLLNVKNKVEISGKNAKKKEKKSAKTKEVIIELKNEESKKIIKPGRPKIYEAYVGNLSFDAKDEDILKFFNSCGDAKIAKTQRVKLGKKKNSVFLRFKSELELNKALELNDIEFMGRKLRINLANNESIKEEAKRISILKRNISKSNLIFVGNLPETITQENLLEIFGKSVIVKEIKTVDLVNNKKKIFAYLEFKSIQEAEIAIKLNNTKFRDKALIVDFAKSK